MLSPNQLRQRYLDFFKARGHAIIPSSSLVPENDPTTLFTGSGMQPMVPYLLGQPHPKGKRIVDSQKCFRSQDIEEVGNNRHTTFFEMLGNWSLGDYFKEQQLQWFFEFLTNEIGLDPHRFYVTVFGGNEELGIGRDEESVNIWKKLFAKVGIEAKDVDHAETKGIQGGRIFYYDQKENWWSRAGVPANMPAGEPGGPDSEVFYDFGPELENHEKSVFKNQPCHVNCDCGRFLEIGNSVFMQYQKQEGGSFKELSQKNVDFGGGFERILAALNNDPDVFKTKLFEPVITKLEELSGKKYQQSKELRRPFRVIADHVKAAVMLAVDGVRPTNKAQGYFSRRLIRRAVRYGQMIGLTDDFVAELVEPIVGLYRDVYPEVLQLQSDIESLLTAEENKFRRTLTKGLKEFEKITQIETFNAKLAFKLFETYGFPLELSIEEARSKKIKVPPDIEIQFNQLKQQHAKRSRTASVGMFKGGLEEHSQTITRYHTATHLLHSALRKVLGDQIEQKGSNITAERLRFDFSFPRALTQEEIRQVERLINQWIKLDLPVAQQTMPKSEALKSGALAFFAERYPDQVDVYTIGVGAPDWVSRELCGGPHVAFVGEIEQIEIFREKSAAAGMRRIYARFIMTN